MSDNILVLKLSFTSSNLECFHLRWLLASILNIFIVTTVNTRLFFLFAAMWQQLVLHFIFLTRGIMNWWEIAKDSVGREKVNSSPKLSFHVGLWASTAHGWVLRPVFYLRIVKGPQGPSRTETLLCSEEMGVLFGKFAQSDWKNKGGVAKIEERTTKRGTVLESTEAACDPWFKRNRR